MWVNPRDGEEVGRFMWYKYRLINGMWPSEPFLGCHEILYNFVLC